jgi:hypothetical protein
MRHSDHVAQDGRINRGEAGEDPRVVRVVVGEEIRVGIGFDERGAVTDGATEDESVVIFAQANEECAMHFQRGGAVGHTIFDTFELVRDLADTIKLNRSRPRSNRPRGTSLPVRIGRFGFHMRRAGMASAVTSKYNNSERRTSRSPLRVEF